MYYVELNTFTSYAYDKMAVKYIFNHPVFL